VFVVLMLLLSPLLFVSVSFLSGYGGAAASLPQPSGARDSA
jgi:hypothetical protein